ncbi:serine/threonine protein kinase [Pseudenhygromyxa sp. WMMC2535]|uniref:serine/threonine-protein kinase n=1 Tax=Pseudenhygromyxa sp. WMMC2535 TaxID=2712867 RepID=UPI00159523C4|nr:serine/threonine-protein kinase [Pseudenhygromyxa sp. WMMC2535]NVB36339.1 serine/threonine protein kinase [Pseudenhygromyxa sp. WMMC2535]
MAFTGWRSVAELGAHPPTKRASPGSSAGGARPRACYDDEIQTAETIDSSGIDALDPRLLPKAAALASISRFRVIRVLGVGAMGVVYEAIDETLGRRVAVKLVSPATRSADRQRRLLREAQAMARLTHPNVVVVYEVGSVGDEVYIAMELVEGPSLATWLAADARSWREILHLFSQAGYGMRAAHAVNLIHRDFKPANVLLGRDGRIRVADFGVARLGESSDLEHERGLPGQLLASMTESGALVGTPAYMAPELLIGAQADALSDQFSFCVALYEALYGVRPFAGADIPELRANMKAGPLAAPLPGRKVPAWVHAAVERGLGPRARRWPSMDALLQALDPEARRRRRGAALLGSALTLLTFVAGLAWSRVDGERCTAEQALIGVWDEDVREEVRGALLATSNGEHTAATVIGRLDTYAEDWQAARTQACEATRVHGEQSEAMMDARMHCLDRRALELGALARVLASADDQVAERAVAAAAALPEIERCADLDYVSAERPPPDDLATEAADARIREALATVRALGRSGRLVEARARSEALLEEAARLGYRPLLAEVGLAHGQLLDELGEARPAAEVLEQAYLDADACGTDELAQEAALRLVHVRGYRLAQAERALLWARLAQAKIDHGGDALARVQLALGRGEVHEAAREPEQALAAYREAQTLLDELPRPDPLLHAEVLDDIGLVQLELQHDEAAQASLEQAYALWTAELGDGHPLVARGLSSLGILHARTGRYREAITAWEAAKDSWTASKGAMSEDVATMHSNLGVVYRMVGDYEAARNNLERALAIREREFGPEEPAVASVLGNLGNLALHQRDFAAARVVYARALAIREREFGADDIRLATMLSGLGEAELGLGHPRLALAALERALAIRVAHLAPGHQHITEIRGLIAMAWLALGEPTLAWEALAPGLVESRDQEGGKCRLSAVHTALLRAQGEAERWRSTAEAGLRDCWAFDAENVRAIRRLEELLAK